MRIPETFIPEKNLDEKIKELISRQNNKSTKEDLYRLLINKYGFFKPDKKDNLLPKHSDCCLAIQSILKDESYTTTTRYDPNYNTYAVSDKFVNFIFIFNQQHHCIGHINEYQRLFVIDRGVDVDKARELASRLNEELRLNLKLKQYASHEKYRDIEI